MLCNQCGTASAADAWFCSKCAAPLNAAQGGAAAASAPNTVPMPLEPARASDFAASGSVDDTFDEEAWRAAIGPKNTDYYLSRFAEQHAGGKVARWHWPAFFVTFYWLLYRKLWGSAILYFVIPYVVALAIGVVGALVANGADPGRTIGTLWLIATVAFFVAPPMVANPLLYARCRNLIERQKAATRSRERALAQIEARGGTSLVGAIILGVFVVIALIGILAAIALPAYNDYTKRAKVAEALVSARGVAAQVGDHLERTGTLPASIDDLQVPASRYVRSMRLDPGNGVIEIAVTFGRAADGGNVYLVPSRGDGGRVTWTCKAAPEMRRVVPSSCRGD